MEIKRQKAAGAGSFLVLSGWGAYDLGLFGGFIRWSRRMIEAAGDAQTLASVGNTAFAAIAIVVGVVCLCWGFGLFEKIAEWRRPGPRIIPLLELCSEAIERGWDLTGSESLHSLDFVHGLRQAGSDGVIKFWGRSDRNDFESLTRNELLLLIPEDRFQNFSINFGGLFSVWTDSSAPKDNFCVKLLNERGEEETGFADIHVSKLEALRWLRKNADQFKGFNKPRQ